MISGANKVISETVYLDRIEQLMEDLIRLVKEELSLVTRNLVVFGSYAKYKKYPQKNDDLFIPGMSDIDVALIVDTSLTNEATKGLKSVVESLNSIIFEPIYAPILDLSILESDIDLPNPKGTNFSLLHLYDAKSSGLVLYGKKDYLNNFNMNNQEIQSSAFSVANQIYSDLKNAYLHRDMYRVPELFWMGVDSVLLSGLTYSNYLNINNGMPSIVKLEIAKFLDEQDISENLKSIVNQAMDFTLHGGSSEENFDYFVESLRFCRKINSLLK